jgi:hypothetical protein
VITPADRPLNAYMSPGVWWSDPERVKGQAERYLRPMLLPDYFQCPSDSSAAIPPEPTESWFPTWQWWGTSYAINWYWARFYTEDSPFPPWVGYADSPGVLDGPWHEQILASKLDRGAAEWTLFLENGLNLAFQWAEPRGYSGSGEWRSLSGWHGEQDVHAAGFLDGSARYQYFDTRYVDGPGWTTWPNRPWDGTSWEPYQDY